MWPEGGFSLTKCAFCRNSSGPWISYSILMLSFKSQSIPADMTNRFQSSVGSGELLTRYPAYSETCEGLWPLGRWEPGDQDRCFLLLSEKVSNLADGLPGVKARMGRLAPLRLSCLCESSGLPSPDGPGNPRLCQSVSAFGGESLTALLTGRTE